MLLVRLFQPLKRLILLAERGVDEREVERNIDSLRRLLVHCGGANESERAPSLNFTIYVLRDSRDVWGTSE